MSELFVERLTAALAEYDAAVAKCPVRNFAVERRVYRPEDKCSACGSNASGSCGKDAYAAYRFVEAARAAIARATGEQG